MMGTQAYINTMKYGITHIYNSRITSETLEMQFIHGHKKNKNKQTDLPHVSNESYVL